MQSQDMQNVEPARVAITGAAGAIGSFLCNFIAQGRMFGQNQPVILHLVELPFAEQALKGLVMELNDGAYPLLHGIVPTTDALIGFKDIDVAVLVGARPRGPGMERSDLLIANAAIFKVQGEQLNQVAKKTVQVCVVGNPCNTNALIASKYAPSIPKENFTSMTRLDQNRAMSVLAEKSDCKVQDIRNVIIWGNHSATQYPDSHHCTIAEKPAMEILGAEYLEGDFITKVSKRGSEIIDVCGKSSAASAANAACNHVYELWNGTQPGCWANMGVISDSNEYGVPEGINFSFPVTIEKGGNWKIVQGLEMSDFSKAKLEKTSLELLEERKLAFEE